jgi:hypothetical protein
MACPERVVMLVPLARMEAKVHVVILVSPARTVPPVHLVPQVKTVLGVTMVRVEQMVRQERMVLREYEVIPGLPESMVRPARLEKMVAKDCEVITDHLERKELPE